jgi:membrane protease YdiL (CAAX protease family)
MRTALSSNRQAVIFVFTTVALTALFQYPIFAAQPLGNRGSMFVFAMMWCPGAAALITSWIARRPLCAIGWRIPAARYLLLGILIPAGYTAATYLLAWHYGAGTFNSQYVFTWNDLAAGWLFGCLFALGEEIGWRGFLTPVLARSSSFPKVAVIVGVIWSVWHFPPILRGDYGSGEPLPFMLLCFTVMLLGMNIAITWLRLSSGSIWPAVLMHGTHNVIIQSVWTPLTTQTALTSRVTGEFGIGLALTALTTGLMFMVIHRLRNSAGALALGSPAGPSSPPPAYRLASVNRP